jgi:malonyl-CoA decarboxylase
MGLIDSLKQRGRSRESAAVQTLNLCRALISERGEVSGSKLAAQALDAYSLLPEAEAERFLTLLAEQFSPEPASVWAAAQAYHAHPTAATLATLQDSIEPPRQELFRRLNMAPGGTATLVRLRRRLLSALHRHPAWATVDADLLHLFRSWFNRGFLVLQRIDWNTPAAVLERLIEYEAVHQIQGWRDLRRRLEADRRCYGFFHPALPGDPLIFIEVALTRGLPSRVQLLLDPESVVAPPQQADHAVFYSITNCQAGLRGVSFGNFLIKQVAEDLGREFPNLRTFLTLSPVPGFRDWLQAQVAHGLAVSPALRAAIQASTPRVPATLEEELSAFCAEYLLHAKRGDRAPVDAVARFHLANGARLEQVNWNGDSSHTGVQRSFGLTANYVYRLRDLEENHEAYAREFRVVAASSLKRLAARAERVRRSPS